MTTPTNYENTNDIEQQMIRLPIAVPVSAIYQRNYRAINATSIAPLLNLARESSSRKLTNIANYLSKNKALFNKLTLFLGLAELITHYGVDEKNQNLAHIVFDCLLFVTLGATICHYNRCHFFQNTTQSANQAEIPTAEAYLLPEVVSV